MNQKGDYYSMKKAAFLLAFALLLSGCGNVTPPSSTEATDPAPMDSPVETVPLSACAVINPSLAESGESTPILGSAEDYARIKEYLATLAPDSLTGFSLFCQTDYQQPLSLSQADSRLLYDDLMLLSASVKPEWSNPPTGGGWSARLENGETAVTLSYNGEWLCYRLAGEDTTYLFNADDCDACDAVGTFLWRLTEDALCRENGNSLVQHTLGQYLFLDPEQVSTLERAIISYGPSIVELVVALNGEQAKEAARALSALVVKDDELTALYTAVGGSVNRYTLTYEDGRTPLILYYGGTFRLGSEEAKPFCYIDSDYYRDAFPSPEVPDIPLPEDAVAILYDIVDGERVARVK